MLRNFFVVLLLGVALSAVLPASTRAEQPQILSKATNIGSKPTDLKFQILDLKQTILPLELRIENLSGAPGKLASRVQDLEIKETKLEIKIELSGDILFDFDKATLRPAAEPTLQQVAEVLRKYPKSKVRVEGHTDSKGSETYNKKLSEQRAVTVKDWLVRQHTGSGSFETQGFGAKFPVAKNSNPDGSDNPEGRQKNRRVEIIVKKT